MPRAMRAQCAAASARAAVDMSRPMPRAGICCRFVGVLPAARQRAAIQRSDTAAHRDPGRVRGTRAPASLLRGTGIAPSAAARALAHDRSGTGRLSASIPHRASRT
ncbi:hypothetical protein ACRPM7_22685, partial [Burkholderia vietnamiensis]|uniref:hypothetical protein n=1 Tax=Burkholderia vietnamiensis TaxID=60552 RepID=UPI003D79373F